MSSLLVAAVIGTIFAFLATQNTVPVSIHLAGYTWSNIPLFVVAIASLLVGLTISWLVSIVNWAFASLTIRNKEVRANKAENTVSQLEKRIHDLQIKNQELESQIDEEKKVHKAEHPSPLHNITHSFSH